MKDNSIFQSLNDMYEGGNARDHASLGCASAQMHRSLPWRIPPYGVVFPCSMRHGAKSQR